MVATVTYDREFPMVPLNARSLAYKGSMPLMALGFNFAHALLLLPRLILRGA
jgi:hypothetical protein